MTDNEIEPAPPRKQTSVVGQADSSCDRTPARFIVPEVTAANPQTYISADANGDPIEVGRWYWARNKAGKILGTGKFAYMIGGGELVFRINGIGYSVEAFTYWPAMSIGKPDGDT